MRPLQFRFKQKWEGGMIIRTAKAETYGKVLGLVQYSLLVT